jgi:outer membrane scaffolding protein for murein synthesis (MipA/OmpV family)
MICVLLLGASAGFAQEAEPGWFCELGAGTRYMPVYSGSDEMKVMPFPLFNIEYNSEYVSVFLGAFDGLGIRLKDQLDARYSLAVGVNMGDERDNDADHVEDVLEGTATLENPVKLFATLEVMTPIGQLSSSLEYLPIDAKYDERGVPDEEYNGMKANLEYMIGFPFFNNKVFAIATVGTTWINNEYADAHHSVLYPTTELEAFDAQSGFSDVHGSAGALISLSKSIETIVMFDWTQLLGDAANSPLTKREFQPGVTAMVSYKF